MYIVSEQKCPYCDAELPKEPKRGATCKKCGKVFHVVTRPSDKKKVIATEEEHREFQREWAEQGELSLLKNALTTLCSSEKDFEKIYSSKNEELEKKFGTLPQAKDVLWGMSNEFVVKLAQKGDWSNLSNLYGGMARYMYVRGRPSIDLQQETLKCLLRSWKQIDFTKAEIVSADICCDICKPLDHKKVIIDEAIKEMPLPQKNCTNIESFAEIKPSEGWCICTYVVVAE